MTAQHRRPAAFRLDDPDVTVAPLAPSEPSALVRVTLEPEGVALPVPLDLPAARRRRFPWATLFWSATGAFALLALAIGATSFIEDLFARNDGLGWLGVALAALACASLLVITMREAAGLMRLGAIEALRERAIAAIASDESRDGRAVVTDLIALTRRTPGLARARATMTEHLHDIIDGGDLVRMAERTLVAPLDEEAQRLVAAAARRVSIVTAVSPRLAIDLLFVLANALGLVRRLSLLYGGRPGTLGLIRLMRIVISHLAVTGGLAASDSLIQQVLGHGIAARLSARLGEGVLNGLLTARLGLAAIDVTRPLPFNALPRPALTDLAGDLLRRQSDAG